MPINEPARSNSPAGKPRDFPQPVPQRPPLTNPNLPPVLVKQSPPFSVRLSQLLWALSFAAGGIGVVFFFVIREDQLPLISEAIRSVDATRSDETYASATDIVYWSAFAIMLTVLLIQITLLVSFMSRRDGIRWWQLSTLIAQVFLYTLAMELVAGGDDGVVLRQILTAQCGLALLALLMSTFPAALSWTFRQHDVRRGIVGSSVPDH